MHLHHVVLCQVLLQVVNGLQITTTYTRHYWNTFAGRVVNGLQITTTYTFVTVVGEFFVVVNGLQKSKKDLRKENPVIAGGIFLFLFDDDFL